MERKHEEPTFYITSNSTLDWGQRAHKVTKTKYENIIHGGHFHRRRRYQKQIGFGNYSQGHLQSILRFILILLLLLLMKNRHESKCEGIDTHANISADILLGPSISVASIIQWCFSIGLMLMLMHAMHEICLVVLMAGNVIDTTKGWFHSSTTLSAEISVDSAMVLLLS